MRSLDFSIDLILPKEHTASIFRVKANLERLYRSAVPFVGFGI
jgi:hypothetical protein